MTRKRLCPDCGRTVHSDPQDGLPGFACRCGWEEDGPRDYGYLTMSERPSVPEGEPEPDHMRAAIMAELDRCGL